MVDRTIVDIVKRYLGVLQSSGFGAKSGILFGSFARGEESEWSDIDLVVIAPEFDHPHSLAQVERLWQLTCKADIRIEPIPCGEKEWETDSGRPILEIARREGVIIAA